MKIEPHGWKSPQSYPIRAHEGGLVRELPVVMTSGTPLPWGSIIALPVACGIPSTHGRTLVTADGAVVKEPLLK